MKHCSILAVLAVGLNSLMITSCGKETDSDMVLPEPQTPPSLLNQTGKIQKEKEPTLKTRKWAHHIEDQEKGKNITETKPEAEIQKRDEVLRKIEEDKELYAD